MSDTKFALDYSKRPSKCKRCKKMFAKGDVRLAKLVPNFFGGEDDSELKQYHHIECLFDSFKRAKPKTRVIEASDDIQDFSAAKDHDKSKILEAIKEIEKVRKSKSPNKNAVSKTVISKSKSDLSETGSDTDVDKRSSEEETSKAKIVKKRKESSSDDESQEGKKAKSAENENSEDNLFSTFTIICDQIAEESSHLKKTEILSNFFKKGLSGNGYKGNKYLFLKLIMPNTDNRVYNLNSKQLIKICSRIFSTDLDEMSDHLNKGDVSETCRHYFARFEDVSPLKVSKLTLSQVDDFLDKLVTVTRESEQEKTLRHLIKQCTKNDLRTFIRLVKKDLKINAGVKVIMDALSPNAYQVFQVSRDLRDVVKRLEQLNKPGTLKKDLSIKVNLMTAIKPMLADACKSVERAFQKCLNGVFAEIKYDGERLQVHKSGNTFTYYSRNLKTVQPHKVAHLKEYIPKAFASADKLILDGEVLLYCNKKNKPLPFGTLGKHKKSAFTDATVCFYVFDCLYVNGKDLMKTPLDQRRKLMEENIKEIPGRIMLSEQKLFNEPKKLRSLMMEVIDQGLEGLVLKDTKGVYEPGKRHWLKMKKDYLEDGSMADTADLVVLGAYYGTGNKGGMRSVFLMGTHDEKTNKWYTVTKVGNGLDDATLQKMQKKIDMVEIKKKQELVPSWLSVHKSLIPDFVVKDPKKSPVWELTGAEFSKSDTHTAAGISIRFPRITKMRDDKSWKEATSLIRLKELFAVSKEKTDVLDSSGSSKSPIKRKQKASETESEGESESESEKKKKKRSSKVQQGKSSTAKVLSNDSKKSQESDSEIPSIFSGKKFFLSENLPKLGELKRYITAYDGDLVDKNHCTQDADYVVLLSQDEKAPDFISSKAIKMSHEQLWKCIKSKTFSLD